ncbi:MAG: 6-phosphofructokinase [Phycisphaeraceae bacterium]|nr:6-phosphofructokinase [Phycisphaeraceae bacterium]
MARTAPVNRIGLLTGGGDCPGLNAVIRAVTKDAIGHGIEVVGIEDGYLGLIENRTRLLSHDDVSNILTAGGTILGSSNKANPERFAVGKNQDGTPKFQDMTDLCMRNIEMQGLDALVVVGGDGTMTGSQVFIKRGVNCIGVPKTIDNDLHGTDLTFGFLTAVQIATDALDRVHTTAASHHRVMVVEVMGRNSGWIALHSGVAAGADIILLPEIPFDPDIVARVCQQRSRRGKRFTIICAAEGAKPAGGKIVIERTDPTSPDPIRLGGVSRLVASMIEQKTGLESRYVVLGHVQRGGTPVAADRVLATSFGDYAMDLLLGAKKNRMVAYQGGQYTDVALVEAAGKQRTVPHDHPLMAAARSVGTSFADRE